ncbi:MAG: type II toxin-antitoxin system PemK/MazF family toxin, partial [Acidimicrobiales bacterium]
PARRRQQPYCGFRAYLGLTLGTAGIPKDSVVNVSQVITVDRALLEERIGQLAREQLIEVDRGLRLSLDL